MKRKVKKKLVRRSASEEQLSNLAAMLYTRLGSNDSKLEALGEGLKDVDGRIESLDAAVEGLRNTPLSAVKEVDRMLKKITGLAEDKAGYIDTIFPDIRTQFNAMAEAVNKISAYANALDENSADLRKLTMKRIKKLEKAGDQSDGQLAKLKHRLKRMEQKL